MTAHALNGTPTTQALLEAVLAERFPTAREVQRELSNDIPRYTPPAPRDPLHDLEEQRESHDWYVARVARRKQLREDRIASARQILGRTA